MSERAREKTTTHANHQAYQRIHRAENDARQDIHVDLRVDRVILAKYAVPGQCAGEQHIEGRLDAAHVPHQAQQGLEEKHIGAEIDRVRRRGLPDRLGLLRQRRVALEQERHDERVRESHLRWVALGWAVKIAKDECGWEGDSDADRFTRDGMRVDERPAAVAVTGCDTLAP